MVRISENVCIGTGISASMGIVGYLGGQTLQLIIPSVSAAGYGLTLGLWAPAGIAMYKLAEAVNERGGTVNAVFAFLGGYFASWAATNLMGFSVNMIAPFMGVTALVAVAGLIFSVAAPVFLCCALAAGYSMNELRGSRW